MTEHSAPWPPGMPCWADITVSDLARSQKFYAEVFGWDFSESGPEFGGYTNALVNGRTVAGMSPPMEGWDVNTSWAVYLATDDIAATHAAVQEAGGQAVFEPMEVGPFGHMGLWTDPAGQPFGAWQSKEHTGFQITEVHGAVAWTDLMSADYARAREFFAKVFGFTYEDMGQTYAMFNVPGRPDQPAGGIGAAEAGTPGGWNLCFWVDDLPTSLETITRAGGKALGEPTAFEFGQYAAASGPDGEVFVIYNPDGGADQGEA